MLNLFSSYLPSVAPANGNYRLEAALKEMKTEKRTYVVENGQYYFGALTESSTSNFQNFVVDPGLGYTEGARSSWSNKSTRIFNSPAVKAYSFYLSGGYTEQISSFIMEECTLARSKKLLFFLFLLGGAILLYVLDTRPVFFAQIREKNAFTVRKAFLVCSEVEPGFGIKMTQIGTDDPEALQTVTELIDRHPWNKRIRLSSSDDINMESRTELVLALTLEDEEGNQSVWSQTITSQGKMSVTMDDKVVCAIERWGDKRTVEYFEEAREFYNAASANPVWQEIIPMEN